MVEYNSAEIYISSKTSLKAKIAAIDAVITALETTALKAAATGNVEEYQLDDGQVKIKTLYRNVNEVANSIEAFMRIRQIYVNRVNGRMVRLVDSKNFKGPGYGR